MKRLLSFFAAGLLAVGSLGVMSCSGDLQNNDVQPLYVVGIKPDNGRQALTVVDDTTQELKFTYKYNSGNLDLATGYEFDAWSNKEGVIAFKICKDADPMTWRDWGGINDNNDGAYTADVAPKPKINSSEFTALNYRGTGLAPSNPGNVFIYDLVDETEYTLTVKYISSSDSVSIKVSTEGSVAEMPEITLVASEESKNFPAKDKDGNELTYTMNRAGTVYTYQFIAAEDEDIDFHLASTLANTIWGSPDSPLFDGNGNSKDVGLTMGIAGDSIADIPASLEADHKYKLTFNASEGLSKATFKVELVDSIEAGKAGVFGNYIYSDAFYTQATASAGVSFKPTSDTFKFKILRDTSADYPVWGSNTSDVELGYAYKPIYYAEEKSSSNPDYMTIKGLEPEKPYRLQVVSNSKNPKDMTFKIVKISEDYHWFWKNVKVSSTATPIFYSSSTGYQTDNMDKFLTGKKTVVMKWLADGSKDNAVELKDSDIPSDCPYTELEEQDGYVRMFVYANVDSMNIYTWGPELYGEWGPAMTEGAFETNWQKPDVTYNVSVSISGLESGDPIVFVGNAYGWVTPFLSWVENDETKAKENATKSKLAVADANGIATLKDFKYTTKGSTMPVVICTMKDVPSDASISTPESFVGAEIGIQTEPAFDIVLDKENVNITLKFDGIGSLTK